MSKREAAAAVVTGLQKPTPLREAKMFGALLRQHRIAAGLSQEALAEKARVGSVTVGSLERGTRRAPFRETVSLLAAALGVNAAQQQELEAAAALARGRVHRRDEPLEVANNLPIIPTSFVSRPSDAANILARFESHRLVTIVGPGGSGKTRLAIELAKELAHARGVEAWFVDLEPLRDGASVVDRISSTISMPYSAPGNDAKRLSGAIYKRPMILLLDNCEHVAHGVTAVLQELLRGCPSLLVLATSRERLRITGEATYRLPPLPLPPSIPADLETALSYGAIELFAARARSMDSTFQITPTRIAIITDICRQLDGLPLAIELAVARLPTLGVTALRDRLQERFVLAGGNYDAPERQRTMANTIAWSYNLLGNAERTLLRRLSIFAGGTTLEGAEAISAGESLGSARAIELLTSLVEKSLVNAVHMGDRIRYSLLNSVRQFCLEGLSERGEFEETADRHAMWLAAEADTAEQRFLSAGLTDRLADYALEFDNMQTALKWLLASPRIDSAITAARILGGFRSIWFFCGQHNECQRWAELILERLDETRYPQLVAKVMRALHQSALGAASMAVTKRAMAVFERVDRPGLAYLHTHLVAAMTFRNRLDEAQRSAELALELMVEQRMLETRSFASLLLNRAVLRCAMLQYNEARVDIESARKIADDLSDAHFAIWCQARLSEVEYCAGNTTQALSIAEELVAALPERFADDAIAVHVYSSLASYRLATGNIEGARDAAIAILENAGGDDIPLVMAIQHIAATAANGDAATASRLIGFTDAWCAKHDYWRMPTERGTYVIAKSIIDERLKTEARARHAQDGSVLTLGRAIDEALTI